MIQAMKRMMALLLAIVMVLLASPFAVLAEGELIEETLTEVTPDEPEVIAPVTNFSNAVSAASLFTSVKEETTPADSEQTDVETTAEGDDVVLADKKNIIIKYQFANGEPAANSWTATVAVGSSYSGTIKSPAVLGYTPDQAEIVLNETNISDDITKIVTYNPAEVDYEVHHYQQNVDNDEYTLFEVESKKGLTESEVGDKLAKSYEGFTVLPYEADITIAADGSTYVEVYYDRNYYLMSFELDGGWGTEPIYARYGTKIENVADPQKAGYTFSTWNPSLPDTMPAGNYTYTAGWDAGMADYLVQYWQENANDSGYTYESSATKRGTVGTKVSGTNDKSDNEKYVGFYYSHADTNVEVKGDGTTVVNVYYKRNTYTLTFKTRTCSGGLFHTHKESCYSAAKTFTGIKYGEDTTKYWNQAGDYLWYVNPTGSNYSDPFYTAAPDMPNADLTIYGRTSSGTSTIYYYEEGTTTSIKDPLVVNISNWSFTTEDYIAIPGFTYKSSNDNRGYYIYYTRNSYTLDFNDSHGSNIHTEPAILYEAALANYQYTPTDADYPSEDLEVGAYTFGGWYYDPGYERPVDWANDKMPYDNMIVYAKWVPVVHTVNYYLTENGTLLKGPETVNHNETVADTEYKATNGNYTFVGWFYRDADNVEHAFKLTTAITQDMNLYAKWSATTMVPYTINYVLEDGTVIADSLNGNALALTSKTFNAKTGNALYEGYQSGYFPKTNSHTLYMDIVGNNVFDFVYVPMPDVDYVIRYLDKETGEPVATEVSKTTKNAVVTEDFKPVTGYMPDAYQKRLVLSANEAENVITFWYTKDDKHAPVKVIHYVQNAEGDGYSIYQEATDLNGLINQSYSTDVLTINGFAFNNATKSSVAEGATKEPVSAVGGKVTATVTAEGLLLELYYNRNLYPYEFKFLEVGTEKVLADSVTGTARFGSQVSQSAEVIPGYTLAQEDTENLSMVIGIEEGETAVKNVRIFYYTENDVTYDYIVEPNSARFGTVSLDTETIKAVTGAPEGSTPTAKEDYKFVGWYLDEACTIPVSDDKATVDAATGKLTPGKNADGIYPGGKFYAKFELAVTDVTVRKLVEGNMGDRSKQFEFTVSVNDGACTTFIITKNGTAYAAGTTTFTLAHGESVTLSKVPIGGKVVVTETETGYITSWNVKNGDTKNNGGSGTTATDATVAIGDIITFTNNKTADVDTGILLDSLPYVLILAVVGAALVLWFIRKRRVED